MGWGHAGGQPGALGSLASLECTHASVALLSLHLQRCGGQARACSGRLIPNPHMQPSYSSSSQHQQQPATAAASSISPPPHTHTHTHTHSTHDRFMAYHQLLHAGLLPRTLSHVLLLSPATHAGRC